MKSRQGGLWILQVAPRPINDLQRTSTVVSLWRTDTSLNPGRTVSYTILTGQTIELECSQGDPAATYRIVNQQ